jgi:hypothetical protein
MAIVLARARDRDRELMRLNACGRSATINDESNKTAHLAPKLFSFNQ